MGYMYIGHGVLSNCKQDTRVPRAFLQGLILCVCVSWFVFALRVITLGSYFWTVWHNQVLQCHCRSQAICSTHFCIESRDPQRQNNGAVWQSCLCGATGFVQGLLFQGHISLLPCFWFSLSLSPVIVLPFSDRLFLSALEIIVVDQRLRCVPFETLSLWGGCAPSLGPVLFSQVGNTIRKGGWFMADGGYHRWRILQCPRPHDARPHMKHFSKGLESVRKDDECTFGTYESFLKSVLYIYAFTPLVSSTHCSYVSVWMYVSDIHTLAHRYHEG